MLELAGVCAGYGRLPVLFDIDITVNEGEVVAVLGHNGAGKSTLLKTMMGVIRPSRGTIVIGGSRVTHEPPHERFARGVALSPEGRRIFASLTVNENLLAGASRVKASVIAQQRARVLDLFPILGERQRQEAGSLSGGEQQMLAIGRALVSGPRILLIDELSLGLAPLVVAELYQSLRTLAEQGLGVLVVDERATSMVSVADRTCVVEQGRIIFEGSHDAAAAHLAAGSILAGQLERQ